MKKLLAIALALTTLLCLAACGSDSDSDSGYKAKTIEENLKKANYDVDVTDDAEEIAEEFMDGTIDLKVLPTALIEADKGDESFIYIATFENEADAKIFLEEWNALTENFPDQAELTLKGNCVYTGDEASVKIAFQ